MEDQEMEDLFEEVCQRAQKLAEQDVRAARASGIELTPALLLQFAERRVTEVMQQVFPIAPEP